MLKDPEFIFGEDLIRQLKDCERVNSEIKKEERKYLIHFEEQFDLPKSESVISAYSKNPLDTSIVSYANSMGSN